MNAQLHPAKRDSLSSLKQLDSITIIAYQNANMLRPLPAIQGVFIFNGKKTETVTVAEAPADISNKTGRQVFAQSCGVCHLPPVMNARTYGPPLSKETAGGNAEIIRAIVSEGGPRMPAFKHYLERSQMDVIIAYLSTVPPAAPANQPR